MPGGKSGTIWDDPVFLKNVIIGLFEVSSQGGALGPQARSAVAEYLAQQGHEVTWDAVRLIHFFAAMSKRQVTNWDHKVHEDILIAVLQHLSMGSTEWSKIMADLQSQGYTFTESALRQHVQKLRKQRDTSALQGAGDGDGGTASKGSTPRKNATPRKRATPVKKTKAATPPDESDPADAEKLKREDNDSEPEFPTPPAKRAKKLKEEPDVEGDDGEEYEV